MKIRVLTESGCGLTKQEANDLGIDFLPLQVQIEDKTYLDGVDLTVEELN
jgi:fatty acid-binding protein DegV